LSRQPSEALIGFVQAELAVGQSAAVQGLANAVRDAVNQNSATGDAVVAILFYGSCLRTGETRDKVLDFYVLVEDYKSAYAARLSGLANRLLPPNVFYLEWSHQDEAGGTEVLRTKYAVVGLDDFARRTGDILDLTIWARFSQPSVLIFAADPVVEQTVVAAVAGAAQTTLAEALPMMAAGATSRDIWAKAFLLTYSAELRAESPDKGEELYALDQARYDALLPLILDTLQVPYAGAADSGITLRDTPESGARRRAKRRWARRRWNGKTLSVLRLLKASFTFDGGIDYLAWKISRHSGVEVEITPWQRRHPILAGLGLFWSLRRKGAFR
jgi:hypothetical protein